MPLFLTLRDNEGNGLATAMLPPGGKDNPGFRKIIVGRGNSDPFPDHKDAINALGTLNLDDGSEFAEITGHSAEVRTVAFDPLGITFATVFFHTRFSGQSYEQIFLVRKLS